MLVSIIGSGTLARLLVFAAILAVMVLAEALAPRRPRVLVRRSRWSTNLALMAIGTGLIRLIAFASVPLTASVAAEWATDGDFGLLHLTAMPAWLELIIAFVVLDLAIWLQHLLSHRAGFLWRFHSVHHVDRDLDASTALRFHPVEIGYSMVWKALVVLALGPTVLAVLLFEIGLNGFAIVSHANLRVPARLDAALRVVFVTPDVHRVHHSTHRDERDSNYGTATTFWDRAFGTFCPQPRDGHEGMTIGVDGHQSAAPAGLWWSLALPLKGSVERGPRGRKKTPGRT